MVLTKIKMASTGMLLVSRRTGLSSAGEILDQKVVFVVKDVAIRSVDRGMSNLILINGTKDEIRKET